MFSGVSGPVSWRLRWLWLCCLWLVTCVGVGAVITVGLGIVQAQHTADVGVGGSRKLASGTVPFNSLSLSLSLSGSTSNFNSQPSSSSSSSPLVSYVILIDAGSTGSRIHVHQYSYTDTDSDSNSDSTNISGSGSSSSRALPVISPSKNKKVKPGLSSYAKKPQEVVSVVRELLKFAEDAVPKEQWKETPIHIQATAGLRALDDHESDQILEVVRNEIQTSHFLFQRSWARIIPGQDEGINGWLATNYLMGVWDTKGQRDSKRHRHRQGDNDNDKEAEASASASASASTPVTTGVVEMGGASIQVTYVPDQVTAEERELLYPMTIAGHQYFVYAYSYLSYGLQAAESAFQKRAIDDIEQDGNPCYPTGLKHSAIGSFARCLSLVSEHLFDKAAACTHHSCSFNGIYQPRFSGSDTFLAIENFFYTTQFFGVKTDLSGRHLVSVLAEKGSEYCGLPWSVIKAQHANTPEQELSSYCFATAYEHSMLTHALGFSKHSNIRAIREIQGKPIDWELGAALRELLRYQQMGAEYGRSPASEYSLKLPASEHARTRVEQRADARLGVSVWSASGSGSWLLSVPSPLSFLFVFLLIGIAIATRINHRNKSRCLSEPSLGLGYAPKSPQHVV